MARDPARHGQVTDAVRARRDAGGARGGRSSGSGLVFGALGMTEHEHDGRLQRAIADWFERELPVHAPPMLLEGVFARTARRRWPWSRLLDHLVRHGPPVAEFAVGLLVVVAFALAVTRTDVTTSSASPAPSDARTLAVGEGIEACGRMPMGLSEAHGSLWVTCADGARRVDPVTGSVGPMLAGVASVSSGSSDTWAAVQGRMARLDPSTGGLGPTVADRSGQCARRGRSRRLGPPCGHGSPGAGGCACGAGHRRGRWRHADRGCRGGRWRRLDALPGGRRGAAIRRPNGRRTCARSRPGVGDAPGHG